jgi:vancomycin aglycone glucosyltransferase
LPRWVNLLLWRVGLPATDAFLRGPLNAARARLGLAPLGKPMRTMLGAGVLVAADRELAPLAEGGPLIAQTDAWLLEDDTPLDPRIDQFLRAGAPPIYIGFGSMVTRKSPELGAQVARAVRSIGCRVVLAGGWASLDRAVHDSDAVLTIRHAPHAKLLPRVTAAVHHGGAGTTTAAAKAGIPQVVVPHILDQYYWGHRVETLALGPRPLPIGRVTANALTARISAALDDSRHRDAAHRLGRQLAGRSGVSAGVDFLERAGAATAGA